MEVSSEDLKNNIEKELDLFENPFVHSYDRIKHNLSVFLNISQNLDIFYSRLFTLISDEISILTGAYFVRHKYSIAQKYCQLTWIEKQKISAEDEVAYPNIFEQFSQDPLEKNNLDKASLLIKTNDGDYNATLNYYFGENKFWKYFRLHVDIKSDHNVDSYQFEWLTKSAPPDKIKFLTLIYLLCKKINHITIKEYEDYLHEKESKNLIYLKTNEKTKYNELEKYLLEKPDEYVFRIILMIIKQKVFRHLDSVREKHLQNNLKMNFEKPMGFFYLKAFYDSQNKLVGFGYFFDIEQVNHLGDYVALPNDYILIRDLRYLESKDMMKKDRDKGLCFNVYEKKDFRFTINWRKYTEEQVFHETIKLEDRFLTEAQLYEWPIYNNENQLIYVACLNIGNKNLNEKEIPFTIEQIEKIHRLIESEFQLNIDYYLTVQKYLEENKERKFLNNKIKELNWRNNHQYEGRYFRPIQNWIDEIYDKLQKQDVLFSDQFIKHSKGIQKRINMFHKIMTIEDYASIEYVNNGTLINIEDFIKNLSHLIDCELATRKNSYYKDYSKIKTSFMFGDNIQIKINEDSLETVVYNIIINAIDVYDESNNGVDEFEIRLNIVKINAEYAAIVIKNTGSIDKDIMNNMNKMFLEVKKQGYEVENYLENSLSNRLARHSGFSLLRIARILFAKIEKDKRGYLEVTLDSNWTVFKVFIPVVQ